MVQFIHPEVGINIAIFSVFFAILSTELMAASAIVFSYKESEKKVFKYLVPIWEITGTFVVFYVVNLEALIPSALPLVAYSFISYILVFLILYVLRNASIISAEFIWKGAVINRRWLYTLYAVITFILGAMVLVIYTAILSGHGLNYSAMSFNILKFAEFLPDDGFIVGSAILLFGLASVYYGLDVNGYLSLVVTAAGMIIGGVSFLFLGDMNNPYVLVIPAVITILIPILWMYRPTKKLVENKLVFQGLMSISVFFLAYSQYPYLLGKSLNLLTLLNNNAMQTQIFYTTIVGGIILLVLTYLFFDVYFKKGERGVSAPSESAD